MKRILYEGKEDEVSDKQFDKCIRQMVQGDKQGLRKIYEAYISYIYTIVYGILGNKENAEDVASEFFIKLWEKAEYYKAGRGHRGYLATMARNMAIDYLRKYKKEELTDEVQEMGSAESIEDEVIGELALEDALKHLKPEEKQIVDMKVLGGLTFKEIAEILSKPIGTVTWKYQNAIKKLRRCGYE